MTPIKGRNIVRRKYRPFIEVIKYEPENFISTTEVPLYVGSNYSKTV